MGYSDGLFMGECTIKISEKCQKPVPHLLQIHNKVLFCLCLTLRMVQNFEIYLSRGRSRSARGR